MSNIINFDFGGYDNIIVEEPKEYYTNFTQAVIDSYFDDNINIKKIKEQSYPFSDEYTEYDVIVDTISDITINTTKVVGDYLYVMFNDVTHNNNVRGQKYLYDTKNNGNLQTYLCYDPLQPLSLVPDFKAIRCNNKIKWIDKDNGKIMEEPIFVGYELTSTNNQVNVDGTVPQRRLVCLVQGNEYTKKFDNNKRFMLNHNKVFKITEVNNVIMNDINNDDSVTMLTMYIEWDTLLEQDNKELNICDYYSNEYEININQNAIEQIKNFEGTLTATTKINGVPVDIPLEWTSQDDNIVTIDNQGNYKLIGNVGSETYITCCIKNNQKINDSIKISIVEDYLGEKIIQVSPIIDELNELDSQEFICGVYINGIKQNDEVICKTNWSGDNYTLEETIDGYKLTNNKQTNKILKLSFTSGSCEPIDMNIKLKGIF